MGSGEWTVEAEVTHVCYSDYRCVGNLPHEPLCGAGITGNSHTSYATLSRDLYHGKSYEPQLLLSWYPHEPVGECVYQENPSGLFHGITVT